LFAHGPMQRAGFTINMQPGTASNPSDGGTICLPDGRTILLDYEDDLYYLPVYTPVGRAPAPARCAAAARPLPPSPNPFHPEHFPRDPAFRAAARKFRCPVCDLVKGARKYRKSARMKQKQERKQQQASPVSILSPDTESEVPTAVATEGAAKVCAAHREHRRVRFAPDTKGRSRLSEDDFLVMVVDGVDFMWASSSRRRQSPEALIDEFLRFTNVKVDKIRMDDAGEFTKSESFLRWCANRGIVICPTAGYNHTMQARAENAVRITKEHIRCLLKTANMPHQFWPWALTQFCRIFNYWPSKGHAPPWVMLKDHRFAQALHRDLHPFGCYIIGRLPREHPAVTNTTLSDRGLEGAFLGWDLSTPTVWMWSFRLRKPIRLHDAIFYDHLYPFSDPS